MILNPTDQGEDFKGRGYDWDVTLTALTFVIGCLLPATASSPSRSHCVAQGSAPNLLSSTLALGPSTQLCTAGGSSGEAAKHPICSY